MNQTLPRRDFLKYGAAALAVASVAPTLTAADAPAAQPALKKAIMYATIGIKGTVLEKLQAVKDAGFAGVEPMGGMDEKEVIDALQATGLKAASVCCHTHWAKPLSDPNPEVRKVGLEGLQMSLRNAKAYGATSVLLVPGVVNEKVRYDEAYERSQVEIRKAISLAQELGVRIAIENVWNNFLLSPLEAARFVDELQSPWVGWHFDIGNVLRYGWPEQWIHVLGKRISRVHVKEYSTKKMKDEGVWKGFNVDFLEGDNNWPAIMQALKDVGYAGGWGIAEQRGGSTPEGLKMLSDRMDKIFAS